MKYLFVFLTAIILTSIGIAPSARAETSLEVRPLLVQSVLGSGEKQRGAIDLTNPTRNVLELRLDVQGFSQIDNQGTLSFFDSEQLRAAIKLDYETVAIPAGKTLRLFYLIDSTKLPQGDVFAAIFATAVEGSTQTSPSVRVGTLLVLTNGTPANHQARIAATDISWLQTTGALHGTIAIENTAPVNTANGFFPEVSVSLWPFGPSKTITGPLVFAGITRMLEIDTFENTVGIFKLTIETGESKTEQLVVMLPPAWIAGLLALLSGVLFVLWRILTRDKRRREKHRPRPLKK